MDKRMSERLKKETLNVIGWVFMFGFFILGLKYWVIPMWKWLLQ